ncbi:MAG: hypothetical protein J1F25_02855, partial [Prevotellaceae bacterium]|nr:hypothetical protein [Prevotellaceae bacterium]
VARYTNCKVDGYPADEAEEGDITGNMTAQVDMNQGMGDEPDLVEDADTFEVTATYDADTKKLTIYNFAESKPITFTVDVEAATATGDADQVAYVEDYGEGYFVSYYYYNIEQQNTAVTAKIYSTDDNKTVLYVDPWGEGADFGPDFGWFNIVAYYNTVVTLDFAIEGLPTKPADDEGDATLEGYWNIPLNDHYAGAWSLGAFTGKYEVTVDGTTVRFTDTEDKYDMVGELTADNKVVFRKTSVGRMPSTFVLTQVPYVNEDGTDEVTELTFIDAITATYNAKESTITFPENCGLAYGYFHSENSELLSYWHAAFDFNGVGTKTGELQSSLTISSLHPEIDENDVTITFDVEAVRLDFASVASWKAQVTEHFSDVAAEKNWDETSMVDATVEDGVGTVVLTNMSNGVHNLSIVLIAYDENGEQIIASNSKDAGITVGPEIMIRAPKATVEGNNVTVTFDATIYGISLDKIASYKALFTDLTTATDDYAGDTTTEDATVEDGVATVTLTNLKAGSYDYSVALIAYNADGEAIATSNTLQFVFTIDVPTGINGVTEGTAVRYYNLQGVEVTNPAAGSIVIKVEGNKAVKVLIK